MIKLGNEEVEGRYITDANGVPHEVVAAYVGDNLVYNAKVEEANAEFYYRKTGGTQSVSSGIVNIKEVRGDSIVWNQLLSTGNTTYTKFNVVGGGTKSVSGGILSLTLTKAQNNIRIEYNDVNFIVVGHKYLISAFLNPQKTTTAKTYITDWSSTKACPAGIWTNIKYIQTVAENRTIELGIYCNINEQLEIGDIVRYKNIFLIDLTLMFGAGNEPATVEEFEKMFPLDYYGYNAGTIIPFAGENLVTTGFNQWDEQWEAGTYDVDGGKYSTNDRIRTKNPIAVFPSTTYYFKGSSKIICYYDVNNVFISRTENKSNDIFTTPANCRYITFGSTGTTGRAGTSYGNDICINISNPDRNGTYEPYEKHTLPLDPSQWRDKQGNLVFPYGGMHGVGNVYDYAKVAADGYIHNAVRVFERRTYASGDTELTNVITGGSTYTFYPLETPVEVELATPVYAKYLVDKDGTEEITPANDSTPYTTMANLHLVYRKK